MNFFRQKVWGQLFWVTPFISVLTAMAPQGIAMSQTPVYSTKQNRYPADVVQSYLKGCNTNGQNSEFCNCTIAKLQQRYSLTQFETLATQMVSTGSIPPALLKVASECVKTPNMPITVTQPRTAPSEIDQLNDQLRQAVDAKNWNQAIRVVDRMIVLFPEQASDLQAYRRRLEALRQP